MPSLDLVDMLVIAGAIAAISWVLWYFFFAQQSAEAATADSSGRQQITVVVRSGYELPRSV